MTRLLHAIRHLLGATVFLVMFWSPIVALGIILLLVGESWGLWRF